MLAISFEYRFILIEFIHLNMDIRYNILIRELV